jgi:hypothetical protein
MKLWMRKIASGQREDRVRQPHAPVRRSEAQLVDVDVEQRDERDLQRDDLQGEHRDEQRVATRERHPRERVGSQGGQEQGQGHRRDGDDDGVDEVLPEARR